MQEGEGALTTRYASRHLRGSDEVILEAVTQDWRALLLAASEELMSNYAIMLQAVSSDQGRQITQTQTSWSGYFRVGCGSYT